MEKEVDFEMNSQCNCKKTHSIIHELSQSLVVIHSYVKGCSLRIKKNDLSTEQLQNHLEKINSHIKIISQKIQEMT